MNGETLDVISSALDDRRTLSHGGTVRGRTVAPNFRTPLSQTAFVDPHWDFSEVGPKSQQKPHSQTKPYTNREQ